MLSHSSKFTQRIVSEASSLATPVKLIMGNQILRVLW